jgi:hypothetical protein
LVMAQLNGSFLSGKEKEKKNYYFRLKKFCLLTLQQCCKNNNLHNLKGNLQLVRVSSTK